MKPRSSISPLYILCALAIPAITAAQRCYYPDGETIAVDKPCDTSAAFSACCNEGAFCLENGLCYGDGVISRGSCTDQSWSDAACASHCTEVSTDVGIALQPCSQTSLESTFVCGLSNSDCIDDHNVFAVSDATNIVLRGLQVAALQGGKQQALTISPTTSLHDSSSGSEPANSTFQTVTATPSAVRTDAKFTTAQMAGVGAGVGIPLLLALLAAIFIILKQRREMRPLRSTQSAEKLNAYPMQPNYTVAAKHSDGGYYRPMSDGVQHGHFREMDPVTKLNEMDTRTERQELGPGK
ncbi:hypothetical protein LTR37_001502 [Vermiconidia calcicola]|uniref:Uncharacterized protein n=1 Tax=Vermiconidia calcicola TaxID=1690605 RepID=A0ACC3NXS4_9PEZI|nr:hypothetical protein LTR37_001502 [Vermiconidia calcicola]